MNADIFAVPSDNLYVDPPKKKKGMGKPPHKRRDTRCDTEVKEREKPKTAHHKGKCVKAMNLLALMRPLIAFRVKLHAMLVFLQFFQGNVSEFTS